MDKKIVALIGAGALVLSGGFFAAGYFIFNKSTPKDAEKNTENQTKPDEKKNDEKTDEKTKEGDVKDKLKDMITNNLFYKKEKFSLSIPVDRPSTSITMETILQEIDHHVESNNDGILNKFSNALADDAKIIVFVGYFHETIGHQIVKLLKGHGYNANIASATTTNDNNEMMIFCGPLENVKNAESLLEWLKNNDFNEARIIYTQEKHINKFKIINPSETKKIDKNQNVMQNGQQQISQNSVQNMQQTEQDMQQNPQQNPQQNAIQTQQNFQQNLTENVPQNIIQNVPQNAQQQQTAQNTMQNISQNDTQYYDAQNDAQNDAQYNTQSNTQTNQ